MRAYDSGEPSRRFWLRGWAWFVLPVILFCCARVVSLHAPSSYPSSTCSFSAPTFFYPTFCAPTRQRRGVVRRCWQRRSPDSAAVTQQKKDFRGPRNHAFAPQGRGSETHRHAEAYEAVIVVSFPGVIFVAKLNHIRGCAIQGRDTTLVGERRAV